MDYRFSQPLGTLTFDLLQSSTGQGFLPAAAVDEEDEEEEILCGPELRHLSCPEDARCQARRRTRPSEPTPHLHRSDVHDLKTKRQEGGD